MRQDLVINAFCLVIAVAAVAFAGWVVFAGQLGMQGIDALFLLSVCLLTALLFSVMPVQAMRKYVRRKRAKGTEPEAAATVERRTAVMASQKPQERA